MVKVKDKKKVRKAKTAKPKVKASKNGAVNAKGIPIADSGKPDKRFKYAPGTRPNQSEGRSPGVTRMIRMKELITDAGPWELVGEKYDPKGVKSVTGAALKKYFVLKNTETGAKIKIGRGEMVKYAGITPPTKKRGKSKSTPEFDGAFDGKGKPKAKAKKAKAKKAKAAKPKTKATAKPKKAKKSKGGVKLLD